MANRNIIGAACLSCTVIASLSAHAANDAMIELLKALRDNNTISEETYEQIKGAAQADDEKNSEGQAEVKQAAKELPKIETKGKLEWSTPDGDFSFRLGGRLHLETAFYNNSIGTTPTGTPNTTTLTDGVDVRRARIELSATLWRVWQFKFDYDFGLTEEVQQGFRDAYIRYLLKGPQPFTFTAGQFKEYYGLESLESSNHLAFAERSLPSRAFIDFTEASDGRRIGFGVATHGHGLWTAAVGIFGKNTSGIDSDNTPDPLVFDGRLTFSPIHTENRIVHLGFAGSWFNRTGSTISLSARPEARIGADALVSTGALREDSANRIEVEAAGVYGPFWLQGEYLQLNAFRDQRGQPDVSFHGWYVFGTWVLTGESRVYDFEQGVFRNPVPKGIVGKGGIGAWEVAARYSDVDLSDKNVNGGREQNFTAGLNWYPTPNLKFIANYVKVLDISGGQFNGADPNIFELFAALYW